MVNTKLSVSIGRIAVAALLAVGVGATSANASSITIALNGGGGDGSNGNQRSFSGGGVTVYATAWYANTNNFAKAALGQYSSGLAVCNEMEDGPGGSNGSFPCDSPYHAIDNDDQRDFVLFLFSSAVDLTSLEVVQIDNDADVSYWMGNVGGAASQTGLLTGKAINNLPAGFESRLDNNGGSRTFNLDNATTTYNALLVAASLANSNDFDDFFKIKTLKFNTVESTQQTQAAVPEPASLALLGSGLVGMASIVRRRKLARQKA